MKIRVREKGAFKRKRDNYARKLRRKKVINYLRSQLGTCTTHGLPYVVNTEIHWFERVFWAISFVTCISVSFTLLCAQYTRYKSTPIVTSVEMDYFNWNISYPAITLCPMYKIEDDDLQSLVNDTLTATGENIDQNLRSIISLSMDTVDVLDYENLEISPILHPREHAAIATMLFKKFNNNSLTTSLNWPISVEIAMTELGLCHVINSNVAIFDNPTKRGVTKYVKSNIDLSVHERDFFTQILNYADVYKIFIHSPDEQILSTTASYTSRLKSFINFGVQVWSTRISDTLRSAPIDLRNCRFIDEPISERYPVYSYNHCILECRIRMTIKLCGCLPHFYKPLDNERVCNLKELPCFVQYKQDIVKLSAPNTTLSNYSSAELPSSPRDCGCLNSCESDVYRKDQETFVWETKSNRARISISAYPKVRIIKDTILNAVDILLRSGGVLNLCVGASVISVMEFIVFITRGLLNTVSFIFTIITDKIRRVFKFDMWTYRKANKKQH